MPAGSNDIRVIRNTLYTTVGTISRAYEPSKRAIYPVIALVPKLKNQLTYLLYQVEPAAIILDLSNHPVFLFSLQKHFSY